MPPPGSDCTVLAEGPWDAGRIAVRWLPGRWRPPEGADARIAAAWTAMQRPGVRLFDGPMARLAAWTCADGHLALTLQATGYRDFVGTNLQPRCGEDADPLGTSCVVLSGDGWLLLGRRSQAVALHPGMAHPFGGGHEPADGDDVLGAVARELREELALDAAPVGLALVREPALRQPELLCAARSPHAAERILAGLDADEHAGHWRCRADAPDLADPALTPVARASLRAWLRCAPLLGW
jgi:ADP-ribose pyrophosphatase YjhB (NUDIX family)